VLFRYRSRLAIGLLGHIVQIRAGSTSIRERVLIVGAGRTAEHVAWLLNHPAYARKFLIIGFIDDDLFSQGLKIYGSRVIGRRADLKNILEKFDVGLIILADHHVADAELCSICENTAQTSIRVFVAPDIFGSLNGLEKSSEEEIPVSLDSFQCQHCIARYSSHTSASAEGISS
jgi:FlaA1/EpsC-like NDP-sugar epimerase